MADKTLREDIAAFLTGNGWDQRNAEEQPEVDVFKHPSYGSYFLRLDYRQRRLSYGPDDFAHAAQSSDISLSNIQKEVTRLRREKSLNQ